MNGPHDRPSIRHYNPDAQYVVSGEELIRLRYLIHALKDDVLRDCLSAERIADRLQIVHDTLPEDPPEAP